VLLRVHLFGGFSLSWGDVPLSPFASRSARSLFGYLVTYRHPHTRDLLAGTFWPDLPNAQARRRLRQALWRIRHHLSDLPVSVPFILTEGDVVRLHPEAPCWADVEAFRAGCAPLEAARSMDLPGPVEGLREAVGLYRGDFMAGYYDDWVLVERERLREMYLAALDRLLAFCRTQGDYEEALHYARQLTMEDPLREEGHREVMRLCYLLGRHREALEQYELCRAALAQELGVEPAAATVALYREIAARAGAVDVAYLPASAPPSPLLEGSGEVPLVGRRTERAALVERLEGAIHGRGGLILVEGEAGVGKTRLLQEIAHDAGWRGARVLWGRGRELAESPPYGVLGEALRAGLSPMRAGQLAHLMEGIWLREASLLLPELAEWLPDLPPRAALEPEQERMRLWEALTRLVLALGRIAPHVLILDDLQWADEATLEVLPYLARRLAEGRVLLILSYRDEEARARGAVWDALRALDRVEYGERLRLPRLTARETGELVRRSLGLAREVPHFERRLYREAEGNPLFVLEMLRALHEEGVLYRDASGEWSTLWDEVTTDYAELPLPPGVYQVIARRLARLEPDERAVLDAAAVLGTDFDFSLLAEASDLPREAVLAAVSALVRRRFLVEEPAAYRFSHDKIRQVAYLELDEEARRRLHRRAGEALEALHPERVEALARHFALGRVRDEALAYSLQAGRRAQAMYSHEEALAHYDQALALAGADDREAQWEIRIRREEVLNVLGRREEQAADLAALADLAGGDPERLAEVHRRRAWLLAHLGRYEEARSAAQRALSLAESLGDEGGQAAALTAMGMIVNWSGRPAEALSPLRSAVRLYRHRGDTGGEIEARSALGNALLGVKAYAAARTELETTLVLCRSSGNRFGEAETLGLLAILHMEQGDTDAALSCYARSLDASREVGYSYGEARTLLNLGNVRYVRGEVGEALRCYDEALAIFSATGHRRGEAIVRINRASVYGTVLGDVERAVADAEAAWAYFRETGDRIYEGQSLGVLGQMALLQGQMEAAWSRLEAGLALLLVSGERWIAVQVYRALVRLSLREGKPAVALEYLEIAESIARELGMADLATNLLADRGAVLLAMGKPAEALVATSEAMARLGPGVEQSYLIPFVHYRVLAALGRDQEARVALRQAREGMLRLLEGVSPEQRRMSLERIPEHRAIVEAWEGTRPRRVIRRLPREGAPTGRALHDDEWVEVIWTVEDGGDDAVVGKVARRRHRLLRLLREAGEQGAAPTVDDLADALGVSRATIKRDLAALRRAGHEIRTRGSRNR